MNSAILIFALVGAYPLGPNFAAGPSHWNADVHAPQAFYPTELNLIADRSMGDCNIPETAPSIFIDYFHADWCGDCRTSTQLADNLKRQGYSVIKRNISDGHSAQLARMMGINTVPYWVIREDGSDILKTNDPQKVLSCLSDKKPGPWKGQRTYPVSMGAVYAPDGSRAPIGYRIGACITDGNCNCVTPMQYGQPVYYQQQQAGFWQRTAPRRFASAPFRWFAHRRFRPLARLFGR